jgi:hypothetical protein
MVLTKDEILHLQKNVKEIDTPYGTVKIRMLTYKEYCEIMQIMAVGTLITICSGDEIEENREIPYSEYLEACNTAQQRAVMYSLSVDDEKWTEEEVQQIPRQLIDLLYEVICEHNNLKQ